MVNLFSIKAGTGNSAEKEQSGLTTNGSGKTGYLYSNKWTLMHNLHQMQKLTKMDHSFKCKTQKYKLLEGNILKIIY